MLKFVVRFVLHCIFLGESKEFTRRFREPETASKVLRLSYSTQKFPTHHNCVSNVFQKDQLCLSIAKSIRRIIASILVVTSF